MSAPKSAAKLRFDAVTPKPPPVSCRSWFDCAACPEPVEGRSPRTALDSRLSTASLQLLQFVNQIECFARGEVVRIDRLQRLDDGMRDRFRFDRFGRRSEQIG